LFFEKISNEKRFKAHCKTIEIASVNTIHHHKGKPKQYPCLLSTNFEYNQNGVYTYKHKFLYKDDVLRLCGMFTDMILKG